MARKTGKDYLKDYKECLKKKDAIEARINKRIYDLLKQHNIDYNILPKITDKYRYIPLKYIPISDRINIIISIEKWLEEKEVYIQTEIKF